jgi:hypothetical protein
MMSVPEGDSYATCSDEELTKLALSQSKVIAKAHAIDELARRAIANPELLKKAVQAIGRERTLAPRLGPPLGWLRACRILESGNDEAISALLQEMNGWSTTDQRDLVRLWSGRDRFHERTSYLKSKYQWGPKFDF